MIKIELTIRKGVLNTYSLCSHANNLLNLIDIILSVSAIAANDHNTGNSSISILPTTVECLLAPGRHQMPILHSSALLQDGVISQIKPATYDLS